MKILIRILKFYINLLRLKLLLLVALALTATFFESISIGLLFPVLIGVGDDNVINRTMQKAFSFFQVEYTLLSLLCVFCVIVILRCLFLFVYDVVSYRIRTGFECSCSNTLLKEIFGFEYSAFIQHSSGEISSIIAREMRAAIKGIVFVNRGIIQFCFMLFYVCVPLVLRPFLTLSLILLALPFLWVVVLFIRRAKYYSQQNVAAKVTFQQTLIQGMQNFKYFKITTTFPFLLSFMQTVLQKIKKYDRKQSLLTALNTHMFDPLIAILICSIIYYDCGIRGKNVLEVVFVLGLIFKAFKSAVTTQMQMKRGSEMYGSIELLENFQEDVKRNQEINGSENVGANDFDQEIRLEHVSFKYPAKAEYLLRDISMTITPKSTIAFVGSSGSGKSTLVNIIAGLLNPTDGKIFLGEKTYAVLNKKQLRGRIGYVSQEKMILNDTVSNNIFLWQEHQDVEKMKTSLSMACLDSVVDALPDRHETVLGENGVDLSGGQRQRLCIAREFYRDADLIIFDEATSDLDSATEREIRNNIKILRGKKTLLIIAHRLSTIQDVERIFVLGEGRILEEGNYQELYNKNGKFREMVALQQFE